MENTIFLKFLKNSIPHAVAIICFLSISIIYFSPQLRGYKLKQADYNQFLGMSKEIIDFREKYDEEPLWTNSMFSGMPAYQISTRTSNLFSKLESYLLQIIPRPVGYIFLMMLGFYIMALCFSINPWAAMIVSIAFGLSSINILYLAGGHVTKVHAISFIPPVIGSIIYTYRKNYLTGSALLSVFLCLHLSANHLQMTYYLMFIIAIVIIVEMYIHLKEKVLHRFVRASVFILIAAILGIIPTLSNLMITYEYSKYTTRGPSQLTISAGNHNEKTDNDALDDDYIKRYNFGLGELWSLTIPNVKGGNITLMSNEKEVIKKVDPRYRESVAGQYSYWGEQEATGGAFYFGASIFLLFILGVFFSGERLKWGFILLSVFALICSLKYSSILDLFIEYFPLFDKFRDTKMMLIIVQISFSLIAVFFLQKMFTADIDRKRFLLVLAGAGGLFLIFYLIPDVFFNFLSKNEMDQINDQMKQYAGNYEAVTQLEGFRNALIDARIQIFKTDCLRSIGFILLTAAGIYLFILNKIKKYALIIFLAFVVTIDLWMVDKRYLNNESRGLKYTHWVDGYSYQNPYRAKTADMAILNNERKNDQELNKLLNYIQNKVSINNVCEIVDETEKEKTVFRELNLSTNYRVFSLQSPFYESRTSYYHKSIGGYHGAKLKIYQELIGFYISNEYMKIINTLNSKVSIAQFNEVLKTQLPVLNMLNTKYIITHPDNDPIINPYHYGNAWFVDTVVLADDPDQEILSLEHIKKTNAVINKKHASKLPDLKIRDTGAIIKMVSYKPNHIKYQSSSKSDQLAIFSEIFYPEGWNAYIDGKQSDYFVANYILRAMPVPKGDHTIVFKFEPKTYYLGRTLSQTGSFLLILFTGILIFINYRNKK